MQRVVIEERVKRILNEFQGAAVPVGLNGMGVPGGGQNAYGVPEDVFSGFAGPSRLGFLRRDQDGRQRHGGRQQQAQELFHAYLSFSVFEDCRLARRRGMLYYSRGLRQK